MQKLIEVSLRDEQPSLFGSYALAQVVKNQAPLMHKEMEHSQGFPIESIPLANFHLFIKNKVLNTLKWDEAKVLERSYYTSSTFSYPSFLLDGSEEATLALSVSEIVEVFGLVIVEVLLMELLDTNGDLNPIE